MAKLNPEESIRAAISVYNIKKSNDINKAFEDSKVSDYFQFSNASAQRFTSKTGAFEFKTKIGFGVPYENPNLAGRIKLKVG